MSKSGRFSENASGRSLLASMRFFFSSMAAVGTSIQSMWTFVFFSTFWMTGSWSNGLRMQRVLLPEDPQRHRLVHDRVARRVEAGLLLIARDLRERRHDQGEKDHTTPAIFSYCSSFG